MYPNQSKNISSTPQTMYQSSEGAQSSSMQGASCNYEEPLIGNSMQNLVLEESIHPIENKEVKAVASVKNLDEKLLVNITPKVDFFIKCLSDSSINIYLRFPTQFNAIIRELNENTELKVFFEQLLSSKFQGEYREKIIAFFNTKNQLSLLSKCILYSDHHQFYTPETFFQGFLENVYAGIPYVNGIKNGKLDIDFKPISSEEDTYNDWRNLNVETEYFQTNVAMVSKEFLAQPIAKITTKSDLCFWFNLIKESLPCQRIENYCQARSEFTASILESMGVHRQIFYIIRADNQRKIVFNENAEQLDVNWQVHRVCATKLNEDGQLYILDYVYDQPFLQEEHPCFNSINKWTEVDSMYDPDSMFDPSDKIGGVVMNELRKAWLNEQVSDDHNYAPNKPRSDWSYYQFMKWNKDIRRWDKEQT